MGIDILKNNLAKFKFIFFLFTILLPFFSYASDGSIDKNKLQLYFESIVSIDSIIPENARTANSLGTVRQGSGVIIDDQTILTIGYIVIEAKEITIGLRNGKKYLEDYLDTIIHQDLGLFLLLLKLN